MQANMQNARTCLRYFKRAFSGVMARLSKAALLTLPVILLAVPSPAQSGAIVSASCPCGYHRERMNLFGGLTNFRTVCRFPALCRKARAIALGNLLDPAAGAGDCPASDMVFYNDPALAPEHPGPALVTWNLPDGRGVAALFEGGYLCPACGRRTLTFRHDGFWD
ncbi:hypothetical protein [Desulfolutivibrio sp.]|uniref:hypothetical protein n=1 Tax=Desulfolutivibrio sp. TaxID=2773296 RepID=UPI002F96DEC3